MDACVHVLALIFHHEPKKTTSMIHTCIAGAADMLSTCGPMRGVDLLGGAAMYLFWQLLYMVKTEMIDKGYH